MKRHPLVYVGASASNNTLSPCPCIRSVSLFVKLHLHTPTGNIRSLLFNVVLTPVGFGADRTIIREANTREHIYSVNITLRNS